MRVLTRAKCMHDLLEYSPGSAKATTNCVVNVRFNLHLLTALLLVALIRATISNEVFGRSQLYV